MSGKLTDGSLNPSWTAAKLAETDVKDSPRPPAQNVGNKKSFELALTLLEEVLLSKNDAETD